MPTVNTTASPMTRSKAKVLYMTVLYDTNTQCPLRQLLFYNSARTCHKNNKRCIEYVNLSPNVCQCLASAEGCANLAFKCSSTHFQLNSTSIYGRRCQTSQCPHVCKHYCITVTIVCPLVVHRFGLMLKYQNSVKIIQWSITVVLKFTNA